MRPRNALNSADPADSTRCQAVFASPLWTHDDLPARQSPTGGLNPGPHRTVLPRRVVRRSGALTAEVLVADHPPRRHHSACGMYQPSCAVLYPVKGTARIERRRRLRGGIMHPTFVKLFIETDAPMICWPRRRPGAAARAGPGAIGRP
jgi:hypothetical protein